MLYKQISREMFFVMLKQRNTHLSDYALATLFEKGARWHSSRMLDGKKHPLPATKNLIGCVILQSEVISHQFDANKAQFQT